MLDAMTVRTEDDALLDFFLNRGDRAAVLGHVPDVQTLRPVIGMVELQRSMVRKATLGTNQGALEQIEPSTHLPASIRCPPGLTFGTLLAPVYLAAQDLADLKRFLLLFHPAIAAEEDDLAGLGHVGVHSSPQGDTFCRRGSVTAS